MMPLRLLANRSYTQIPDVQVKSWEGADNLSETPDPEKLQRNSCISSGGDIRL